jgi:hypothetical protein
MIASVHLRIGGVVTNRRHFLQAGLVLSTASAGVLRIGDALATGSSGAAGRVELFVFDRRFDAAVAAAARARRHGIPVAGTAGDVTHLWYDTLDLQWKRAPMTLAGVTTRGALFVLETLAQDRGMRVVERAEIAAPGEPLHSWTIAPRANA